MPLQAAAAAAGALHARRLLTDRRVDVGLENLSLVQLLVPVSGDPYLAQGPFLREDDLGVKHDCRCSSTFPLFILRLRRRG